LETTEHHSKTKVMNDQVNLNRLPKAILKLATDEERRKALKLEEDEIK